MTERSHGGERALRQISRGLVGLSGDAREVELRQWSLWLARVPAIRRSFIKWSEDFDPLRYNEAASVALLANAASKVGYLALTEYVAIKRRKTRGRPFRKGRCDLWIADGKTERSWAFEFKQHFCFSNVRAETLHQKLDEAVGDADEVDRSEGDKRFGCLIVGARNDVKPTRSFIERMDRLMSEMPMAFRINGGCGPVWLGFKEAG
ncbi:hypothetical protein [Sphingomonas sp.]|uniref:hypothetical protein n=1 Tax=Sphingomonas sp. TaxID=28214 RepID=UPI002E15691F